jgi:hypothetical protein
MCQSCDCHRILSVSEIYVHITDTLSRNKNVHVITLVPLWKENCGLFLHCICKLAQLDVESFSTLLESNATLTFVNVVCTGQMFNSISSFSSSVSPSQRSTHCPVVDCQPHHLCTLGFVCFLLLDVKSLCQAGKHLSHLVHHNAIPCIWYVKLLDNGFCSDIEYM